MHDLSRRALLRTGAAAAGAATIIGASGVTACSGDGRAGSPGATVGDGYHMPLEHAPHERTFMQWPVSVDVYDSDTLRRTQRAIARIANTISRFEPVVMLADAAFHAAASRLLDDGVTLWDVPTDDLWCRDSGPTFVLDAGGSLAVMDFHFNGWGDKQPHANDARVAGLVARRLGLPLIDSGLVGEQGGVEHDGAGLVLAHASSWVNPNRNRAGADVIGDRLLGALGGARMIWAPGVIGADITDYHIDSLARFVGPGKLLIQMPAALDPDDPWSRSAFETHGILQAATGSDGEPLDIVVLAEPVDIRSIEADFVSSYVNYYVCNGAVIAAQFGDDQADAAAATLLATLYPGREVVMIEVDALAESGGGIHCATQQQPRTAA